MPTKKTATTTKAVKKRMHQFKHHETLEGGRKIKNPKQAIAIGLNEARKAGADVPPPPAKKKATKKTAVKSATKKRSVKKTAARKTVAEKAPAKKAAPKKATKKR